MNMTEAPHSFCSGLWEGKEMEEREGKEREGKGKGRKRKVMNCIDGMSVSGSFNGVNILVYT